MEYGGKGREGKRWKGLGRGSKGGGGGPRAEGGGSLGLRSLFVSDYIDDSRGDGVRSVLASFLLTLCSNMALAPRVIA